MIRRFLLLTSVLLVLALGAYTVYAEPVTLMLDWFPNPDHVPVYVALEKGFFAAGGLEVELQVPADPNDPLKLVAAGRVDFAVSYQPSVIIARSEGLPILTIGVLIEHPLSTIMYLRESKITKPSDFKGKKVGVSVSPLYDALFEAVAEKGGLRKEDYQLINVGFNLTPALLSKQVDAVVGAFKNYEKIQAELEGAQVDILPLEENGVPDFYELVLITSDSHVSKRSKIVDGFMRGLAQGIEFTLTNPDQAFAIFLDKNPDLRDELNKRAFDATLPYFPKGQAQSAEKWIVFQDFMLGRKLIAQKSAVGSLFTNRFVP